MEENTIKENVVPFRDPRIGPVNYGQSWYEQVHYKDLMVDIKELSDQTKDRQSYYTNEMLLESTAWLMNRMMWHIDSLTREVDRLHKLSKEPENKVLGSNDPQQPS